MGASLGLPLPAPGGPPPQPGSLGGALQDARIPGKHSPWPLFPGSSQGSVQLPRLQIQTVYQDSVYLIARSAAVTTDYKLGGMNHRDWLFSISGGWKAKTKMSAGPVPSEAVMGKCTRPLFLAAGGLLQVLRVPWLVDTSPRLCLRVTWHSPRVCLSVSALSLFIGDQSH